MSGVIGMPVDEYMKIIDKLHKMRKLRELMKKAAIVDPFITKN